LPTGRFEGRKHADYGTTTLAVITPAICDEISKSFRILPRTCGDRLATIASGAENAMSKSTPWAAPPMVRLSEPFVPICVVK